MRNKYTLRLYQRWHHIMERCYNPNRKDYRYYGAKGIGVDEVWHKFGPFYIWLVNYMEYCRACGMTDVDKLVVDRIDPTKSYGPGNCRLITVRDNALRSIKRRDSNGRFAKEVGNEIAQ